MLDKIIELLPVFVPAVIALVSLFLSESARKKLKGVLNEMPKLRKANYRESGIAKEEQQTFNRFVEETKVDKKTDNVVFTGSKIDLQEMIQSCAETALTKVLAKFLPSADGDEVVNDNYYGYEQDLDALTETLTEVDKMRAHYGLNETANIYDIQDFLTKKINKAKEVAKNEEKKTAEENEQA